MKRNTLNLDSNIFIFARYFSFSLASLISIFLNVFFFQALDTGGFWYILFGISILLESAKVTTILSRNVFSSLYLKTIDAKIKKAQRLFLIFYLTLAVMSVSSGAGFAYYSTETADTTKELEVTNIENKIEMVGTIRDRIEAFSDNSDVSLSEYVPYINISTRVVLLEDRLREMIDEFNDVDRRWRGVDQNREDYETVRANLWSQRAGAVQRRDTAQRELNNAVSQRQQVEIEYRDRGENFELRLEELDAEFMMTVRALDITTAGLELPLIARSRLVVRELEQNLDALNAQIKREKGMQIIFDDLGGFLGVTPRVIKLFILLFMAFCIELIIYTTAPDIKVTRKILYYFRNHIPNNVNVEELLQKFDDEINRFKDKEESEELSFTSAPLSEVTVPEVSKPKRKRNLQEKIARAKKAKEEAKPEPKKIKRKKIKNIMDTPISEVDASSIDLPDNKIKHQEIVTAEQVVEPVFKQAFDELKQEGYFEDFAKKVESLPPDIRPMTTEETTELEKKVEKKVTDEPVSSKESIKYRFGRTTPLIAEKLKDFIKLCIENPGNFKLNPDVAAEKLKLSKRAKDVFLQHIADLRYESKQLIYKNKVGEYVSNFTADDIISYATEIINE